jgi:hypothetical protein
MPRTGDVLSAVRREGEKLLHLVEGEIARLSSDLEHLRNQFSAWRSALDGGSVASAVRRRIGVKVAPARARGAAKRPMARKGGAAKRRPSTPAVDWGRVLGRLPARFSMDELVKATPGLGQNPRARFIALARWTRGKQIKKVGTGSYQRL